MVVSKLWCFPCKMISICWFNLSFHSQQISNMDSVIFSPYILPEENQVWDKLQDNRDLGLILNWSPPDKWVFVTLRTILSSGILVLQDVTFTFRQVSPAMVKSSFEADRLFLRLRTLLVGCLRLSLQLCAEQVHPETNKATNTANHIVTVDGKENGESALSTLENSVEKLREKLAEVTKNTPAPVPLVSPIGFCTKKPSRRRVRGGSSPSRSRCY